MLILKNVLKYVFTKMFISNKMDEPVFWVQTGKYVYD